MNSEELEALLRAADTQAITTASRTINIDGELAAAREMELDIVLRSADAHAITAARTAIDLEGELVAAKAAAASQLITEQATGEAPPAAVVRSLMRIVDADATITFTTSAARRRHRLWTTMSLLCVFIGATSASVMLQHPLHWMLDSLSPVVAAIAVFFILTIVVARFLQSCRRHSGPESAAFTPTGRAYKRSSRAKGEIPAVALSGHVGYDENYDSDQQVPGQDSADPLEPASEWSQ